MRKKLKKKSGVFVKKYHPYHPCMVLWYIYLHLVVFNGNIWYIHVGTYTLHGCYGSSPPNPRNPKSQRKGLHPSEKNPLNELRVEGC